LDLFDVPKAERDAVFPPSVRAQLAVEAGATQGWHRYVSDAGQVIGVDRFGASARSRWCCANTGSSSTTSIRGRRLCWPDVLTFRRSYSYDHEI
jgi:transketolase